MTVDLIVAGRAGRIRAILASQPVPSLPFVLTAGRPLVLATPDPDVDDGYRAERADYDDQEATNPD